MPKEKKQKTLASFGFTKSVTHRGKTKEIKIPLETDVVIEKPKSIQCSKCPMKFMNQQGLSVHLKCLHSVMPKEKEKANKVQLEDDTIDIVRLVMNDVVDKVVKRTEKQKPGKRSRTAYSAKQKADVINDLLQNEITQQEIAEKYGISQCMVSKWMKDKKNILKEAADGHRKLFQKGRKSVKHMKLNQELWESFKEARSKGHCVNFQWLKTRATTIHRRLTNNNDAIIGKHVIVAFLRKYSIRMRRKQRNKEKSKAEKVKPLQKWHAVFRERCIRSGFDENYDQKWGRFKPHQRLNVDQSPLPFVLDAKRTYEHVEPGQGKCHNTWISQPGKTFYFLNVYERK